MVLWVSSEVSVAVDNAALDGFVGVVSLLLSEDAHKADVSLLWAVFYNPDNMVSRYDRNLDNTGSYGYYDDCCYCYYYYVDCVDCDCNADHQWVVVVVADMAYD